MQQPDLTFRIASAPYSILNALYYTQIHYFSGSLPVNQGEKSNEILFRIYNNYARNSNISTALNIRVTTFDGISAGSRTTTKLPVSQCWINFMQKGYGENSTPPGVYTQYVGDEHAVGGSANAMIPEFGSQGIYLSPHIRAGSAQNGVGFIELSTYAKLPASTMDATYNLALTINYDWAA